MGMSHIPPRSAVRRMAAFIFTLSMLSGCYGTDSSSQPQLVLSDQSDDAVVIIGMRSNTDKIGSIRMSWRELDATGLFFKDEPAATFNAFRSYQPLVLYDSSNPLIKKGYVVQKVKPGTYALESLSSHINLVVTEVRIRPNSLKITLEKGEAIYFGDFLFHSPPYYLEGEFFKDKPLFRYSKMTARNDGTTLQAAQSLIDEKHPDLLATVQLRRPTPITLRLPEVKK